MTSDALMDLVKQHSENISMLQGQAMVHQAALISVLRVLSDQQRRTAAAALEAAAEDVLESLDQRPVSDEIRGAASLFASALLQQLRPPKT